MSAEGEVRDRNAADFDLIETLRWEPAAGFVRLDRHLARLAASALELGFHCDPVKVGEVLRDSVGAPVPLRARLTLTREGDVDCATQPYEPVADDIVWNLRIASVRLDSADPLLRHKTSRREGYIRARAEYLVSQADEVILLNERGDVCEGTITNIFIDPGHGDPMLTPALACGLLPGVLRGEMLDAGRAVEATLVMDDLRDAKALFLGNSLRGLIPARLA